jgi:hypothetical protein
MVKKFDGHEKYIDKNWIKQVKQNEIL